MVERMAKCFAQAPRGYLLQPDQLCTHAPRAGRLICPWPVGSATVTGGRARLTSTMPPLQICGDRSNSSRFNSDQQTRESRSTRGPESDRSSASHPALRQHWLTLEALQRYRELNKGKTLPSILVMEEAHTFVKRYRDDSDDQNATAICCQVFEKIAREGRKFGLGLVLSSQLPTDLSPTVLSQCNTYLLHRISNDRDQELVRKLVPDNLQGLLRICLPCLHVMPFCLAGHQNCPSWYK